MCYQIPESRSGYYGAILKIWQNVYNGVNKNCAKDVKNCAKDAKNCAKDAKNCAKDAKNCAKTLNEHTGK